MKEENKHHVLLVEDDIDFGNILKQYLEITGYNVTWFKDGEEALNNIKSNIYNICVLDVMMPKMDGFTLAENITKLFPELPFVFLTARKLKEDKLKGLKLGADDYIVKPFEADELVLRLHNILKRTNTKVVKKDIESKMLIGFYTFDTQRLELTFNDSIQKLTEKETELILFLFKHKNQLLKREAILNAVWKNDDFFSGRSMDVFISRLRKYFKKDPNITIESSRGIGLEFKIS
ncbi:DNA-binding response regulator [Tenacibaculum sp. E3R01]|uniref:response regulator transcription factor n=1 Tax=unclassified Tenacibaculum TaxID=2635139 RepID=UPI0008992193|nr:MULTISPECIES: response regulator transcription factor [unclassified Tenacibaculum]RBW55822.1 DNA-binding response regulator [Tenacibaculum sp. E3R01]SEE63590.1 DNA-binding response regulator, OmpR family, contains REC and winged-helix (wHTH) domain [Tenacibaculum sp. MAR_2010_89]